MNSLHGGLLRTPATRSDTASAAARSRARRPDPSPAHDLDRAARPAWQPAGTGPVSAAVGRPVNACACGGGCPRCRPVAAVQLPAHAHGARAEEAEADAWAERLVGGGARSVDAIASGLGLPAGLARLHHDGAAARSAQALGARAYAVGHDIWFGAGEFSPGTARGSRLLAHEMAHLAQQRRGGPARVQRQDAGAAAATPPAGTLADVATFVGSAGTEPDPTLAAAMGLWSRYSPQVTTAAVAFRLLPADQQGSHLGDTHIGGRSHWENNNRLPVIELPQEVLDDIAGYLRVRGTPAAAVGATGTPADTEALARAGRAPLERAHEAVRLIGHEMYHLWRGRTGNTGNPLQAGFDREAARRMAEVRANWVAWLRDAPPASRREMGVDPTAPITRWEDIPATVQTEIETGAAQTDYIDGLYQRSAYLVEEIYTKVEELSYLRVQQRDSTATVYAPSQSEVSTLARLVYYLHNVMNSMQSADGLITPALYAQTQTTMLATLRARYPSPRGAAVDSYEVVFYLSAINGGLAPIYADGVLISRVPGVRLPPPPVATSTP